MTRPTCWVACGDLIGASQLRNAATAAGLEPLTVRGAEDMAAREPAGVRVVLVDLNDPQGGMAAVEAAVAAGISCIAIGPHVDGEALQRARLAGATDALPHSAVAQQLVNKLALLAGAPPGAGAPGGHA